MELISTMPITGVVEQVGLDISQHYAAMYSAGGAGKIKTRRRAILTSPMQAAA